MGKIPSELREIIAWNIRDCRYKRYPGPGGSKQCAEAFKVQPQQWSHWETGNRTPDEASLAQIARFFDTTVEYMRRDNRSLPANSSSDSAYTQRDERWKHSAKPGSLASFFWLLHDFIQYLMTEGIKVRIDRRPNKRSERSRVDQHSE